MRCASTHFPLRFAVVAMLLGGLAAALAGAQQAADASPVVLQQLPDSSPVLMPPPRTNQYSSNELVDAGHHFFGDISHGLASIVEKAVSQWGLPNGYILGEEASGAFIGGLRYGEGRLYTKDLRVFWQGPSFGLRCRSRRRADHDAGVQAAANGGDFRPLRRYRGLCLFRRRPWHDGADGQRYRRGAYPFRSRAAAWSQSWLSQIHGTPNLEPVLTIEPVSDALSMALHELQRNSRAIMRKLSGGCTFGFR